jgi:HSP20 family protein
MMTSVTRWEPFGLDLPMWMERLFDERPSMRVEEFMEDGILVVRAEMPGIDIDKDVDISVHEGMLHIKAQRTQKEEKKDKTYFRSEFRYGAFERTSPLPPGATVDDVKATYEDGVVEIRIPAAGGTEVAKVPVQRV